QRHYQPPVRFPADTVPQDDVEYPRVYQQISTHNDQQLPQSTNSRQLDFRPQYAGHSYYHGAVGSEFEETRPSQSHTSGYTTDHESNAMDEASAYWNDTSSNISQGVSLIYTKLSATAYYPQDHYLNQLQNDPPEYILSQPRDVAARRTSSFTAHHLKKHQQPRHVKRSRNHNNWPFRQAQQWIRHTSSSGVATRPERVVPILGLFDLSVRGEPRQGGRAELAAAQLALTHINEQHVIPGYKLVMFHNDTKCDSGSGVDAFFHAIYTSRAKMMILLGAACPEVTESLASVVHYWNIVQVSFGSVSPALSDRSSYPRFIRTVAPDSSHNAARLAFLTHHSWSTVTTISENHDMYT
ncbi:hypothetical protein OTU49_009751, partial [Cherax quadricarinatus]